MSGFLGEWMMIMKMMKLMSVILFEGDNLIWDVFVKVYEVIILVMLLVG